jgi:hypothetical protein
MTDPKIKLCAEVGRLQRDLELLGSACDKLRLQHSAELRPLQMVHTQNLALLAALRKIAAIENLEWGGEWEEIEQAREIAHQAIAQAESNDD